MDKNYTIKVIGGAFCLLLVICGGFVLYEHWARQRFNESLPPAPQTVTMRNPDRQPPSSVTTAEPETQSGQEMSSPNLEAVEPNALETQTEESAAIDDALLDMFEEQALSALRESVDITDEELDNEELVAAIEEEYGHSPEVEVMSDVIERIQIGTATLDDLIEMIESSLAIAPGDSPGAQQALAALRAARHSGGVTVMMLKNVPGGLPSSGPAIIIGTADMMNLPEGSKITVQYDDGTTVELGESTLEGATVIK